MKRLPAKPAPPPQPRQFNKTETDEAWSIINDFFQYAHLPQAKEKLWDWLQTTVTGSFCKELNCRERCNLVFFYQQVEKLIEAALVITSSPPFSTGGEGSRDL
jgi:hypothetical protein